MDPAPSPEQDASRPQPFGPPERGSLAERISAKLRFIPTTLAFAFHILRPSWGVRPVELWMGDSHAMTYNRNIVNSMFLRASEGQFILRAGARLMYSISTKGFPRRIETAADLVALTRRRGRVVPFFMAGEIDVRAHLVKHEADFSFVNGYVARCADLASKFGADEFFVVVPPPPVDLLADECWYPIEGLPTERAVAHGRLRAALRDSVEAVPGAHLLDATDDLADDRGIMHRDRTVDGCHTNLEAIAEIRARVHRELGLAPKRGGRTG